MLVIVESRLVVRSVVLVSESASMPSEVLRALAAHPRFEITDNGSAHSRHPLTNVEPFDWSAEGDDWLTALKPSSPSSSIPSMVGSAMMVSCRSAAWIAETGLLLAAELREPAWFIGNDEVAWLAGQVDPARIDLG